MTTGEANEQNYEMECWLGAELCRVNRLRCAQIGICLPRKEDVQRGAHDTVAAYREASGASSVELSEKVKELTLTRLITQRFKEFLL